MMSTLQRTSFIRFEGLSDYHYLPVSPQKSVVLPNALVPAILVLNRKESMISLISDRGNMPGSKPDIAPKSFDRRYIPR